MFHPPVWHGKMAQKHLLLRSSLEPTTRILGRRPWADSLRPSLPCHGATCRQSDSTCNSSFSHSPWFILARTQWKARIVIIMLWWFLEGKQVTSLNNMMNLGSHCLAKAQSHWSRCYDLGVCTVWHLTMRKLTWLFRSANSCIQAIYSCLQQRCTVFLDHFGILIDDFGWFLDIFGPFGLLYLWWFLEGLCQFQSPKPLGFQVLHFPQDPSYGGRYFRRAWPEGVQRLIGGKVRFELSWILKLY